MRYVFKASKKNGEITNGEYEADSPREVMEHLAKRNLIPVSILPQNRIISFSLSEYSFWDNITAFDRIILVRNLAITTKVGLNIVEALDMLTSDAAKKSLRKILNRIKVTVENGQPLWQGFQSCKEHFPPFFVGMVKAAETSGKLDKTLTELSRYMTRE